jgi:hypothetical protein
MPQSTGQAAPPVEKATAEMVARCESCFAYINHHAKFVRDGWWCPLCHNTNALPSRYTTRTRKFLPELQEGLIEFDVGGTCVCARKWLLGFFLLYHCSLVRHVV